jgi:hypothetical protein
MILIWVVHAWVDLPTFPYLTVGGCVVGADKPITRICTQRAAQPMGITNVLDAMCTNRGQSKTKFLSTYVLAGSQAAVAELYPQHQLLLVTVGGRILLSR